MDLNIHFAGVIRATHNIIPLDATTEMGSDFELVQGWIKDDRFRVLKAPWPQDKTIFRPGISPLARFSKRS